MHGLDDAIQQDIGELAAHSCPLERKGNGGGPSQQKDVLKCTTRRATIHYQVRYTTEPYSSQSTQSDPVEHIRSALATVMGNYDRNSVKRVPKPVELWLQLTVWEGIMVDVLNNRSQMSQVSGIMVAVVIQPPKRLEFCLTTGIMQHTPSQT
ncbi:hypothetical protein R3P38DRAFT_2794197 [Favolaschia claudopus]|uniref:Uncharacterized protein n=1 Tax=Favolaschia claudopus TaxID=2862362 RepID=A0AAW0ABG6_9AGAR